MEIPVIAFDIGGIKEALKDKITGYLLSNHDIDKTKTAIVKLMENPSLISAMGIEGRRFVQENFDIKKSNKR
jgi:glycosyltransferase involved in cell wall biosynthesis